MEQPKETLQYSAWKCEPFIHRNRCGSTWYRGNFTIGLLIDSHPRFVNVIVGLGFVEFGLAFTREGFFRRI